jgi:DNA-binding transcriptional regulator YdaS (Cro superfamily)
MAKSTTYEEYRTALLPGEKLRVAVAVLLDGFDQHKVAALMGVNPGRVNEAVQAVRRAIDPEANDD